jgi:ferritin
MANKMVAEGMKPIRQIQPNRGFTPRMEKLMNRQIKIEIDSAHIYLAMYTWADTNGLEGAANFFKAQYCEELEHAQRLIKHCLERDIKTVKFSFDVPPKDFKGLKDLLEKSLEHEKKVTASYESATKIAEEEGDMTSHAFMHWFLIEQVEEEDMFLKLLGKLKVFGEDGAILYMIDKEMGERE